jgi:hydrogenase maturation factor
MENNLNSTQEGNFVKSSCLRAVVLWHTGVALSFVAKKNATKSLNHKEITKSAGIPFCK